MEYILPNASDEQLEVIEYIKNNNVVIQATPGSGKTTLILHIAKRYKKYNILALTYNAKLKLETRERANILELNNLEVHSYHSFCVKYYDHKAYTDMEILDILQANNIPKRHISYDIIILDESQDITPLYYELVCKIYNNCDTYAHLCILGDPNQAIYEYNKATSYYIQFAPDVFNFNECSWKKCTLSYSFRLSCENADFINKCMLGYDRIKSNKTSSEKPRYVFSQFVAYKEVLMYLDLGYKFGDIFVLGASVKNIQNPLRQLANNLTQSGIPLYVPISDDEKIDLSVCANKIVFSTFHQAKGLERKVVIVIGFDESYFRYYAKDADPCICANPLYVATSRAIDRLSLIHFAKNDFLPFLDAERIHDTCNIIGHLQCSDKQRSFNPAVEVTDLIKYIPQEVVKNCISFFEVENIWIESNMIEIPTKIKEKFGWENVYEINGNAIPLFFILKMYGKSKILETYRIENNNEQFTNILVKLIDRILYCMTKIQKYKIDKIDKINKKHKYEKKLINALLFLSTHYTSECSGYIFKLMQIGNYNWIDYQDLQHCINRLKSLDLQQPKFEVEIELHGTDELFDKHLVGRIDCVDIDNSNKDEVDINLYEFKCVSKLNAEYYIQLAIYAFIFINSSDTIRKYKLYEKKQKTINYYIYNILTDELDQLIFTKENLSAMITYLIKSKYFEPIEDKKSKVKFIEQNIKIAKKYDL